LAVHNGGPPIAAGQLDGLFNPLQSRALRPARSDEGPTSSLGLGLYIAERIVHAHGGFLAVTSGAGEGTTFTLTLPRD
jgi:signal transduction histidine kinase